MTEVKEGKFELLDYCHHLSSGMKSVYTQQVFDGLLLMRQSIGGAGFSAWSGLPRMISEFSPVVTFEGDNTVMAQQSCNYIFKLAKPGSTSPDPILDYIWSAEQSVKLRCKVKTVKEFSKL